MRRKLAMIGTAVLLAAVVAGSRTALGASYNPLTTGECPEASVLAPGATVYLFHGGRAETRGSIHTGDVLAVLRPRLDGHWHTVGTVRIDVEAGEFCFRTEVVEGELRPYDIALAGGVALLAITSDAPCLFESRR